CHRPSFDAGGIEDLLGRRVAMDRMSRKTWLVAAAVLALASCGNTPGPEPASTGDTEAQGQRWQAALRRRGEAGRVPVPAAGQQAAGGPSSPRAETPVPAENS